MPLEVPVQLIVVYSPGSLSQEEGYVQVPHDGKSAEKEVMVQQIVMTAQTDPAQEGQVLPALAQLTWLWLQFGGHVTAWTTLTMRVSPRIRRMA